MGHNTRKAKGLRLQRREVIAMALLLTALLLTVLLLPVMTRQLTRQQLMARPQVTASPVPDLEFFHEEDQ